MSNVFAFGPREQACHDLAVLDPDALRANTRESLSRLRAMTGKLDPLDLKRITTSGWSVAGTLAHLAFYDDWVAARWRDRLQDGTFQDLPEDITHLANRAGARGWQQIDANQAAAVARAAAEDVASLLETLPRAAVEDAVATKRPAMLDRSVHWGPHLDEIEAALRG